MYKCGTIVLIPFPFTDLTSQKLRPALIISSKKSVDNDIIVSFITSKITKHSDPSDYMIDSTRSYFKKTGLKTNSIIRFNKIATLNTKLILGELGVIPRMALTAMRPCLKAAFGI